MEHFRDSEKQIANLKAELAKSKERVVTQSRSANLQHELAETQRQLDEITEQLEIAKAMLGSPHRMRT